MASLLVVAVAPAMPASALLHRKGGTSIGTLPLDWPLGAVAPDAARRSWALPSHGLHAAGCCTPRTDQHDVRTCSRSVWAHIPGLDRRRAFRAVEAGGAHQADGDGDGPHDAAVRAGGAGGRGLGGRRAEEPRGALEGLGDVGGALRAVVALRAVGAGLIPGLPVGSVAVGTSGALDGGDGGLRAVAA